MALEIELALPSGVVLRYHRIVDLNLHIADDRSTCEVESYVDREARAAGKEPARRSNYRIGHAASLLGEKEGPMAQAYTALKSYSAHFKGAKDEMTVIDAGRSASPIRLALNFSQPSSVPPPPSSPPAPQSKSKWYVGIVTALIGVSATAAAIIHFFL